MILPLLIGGVLLFGAFAMAKKPEEKQKASKMGVPTPGSVWSFVMKISPPIDSKTLNDMLNTYKRAQSMSGNEVVSINAPDGGTVLATVKYGPNPGPVVVGAKWSPDGKHSVSIQSASQVG